MSETLYTTKQAAELTGKTLRNLQMLIVNHGIGRKLGRDYFFTEEDLATIRKLPKPGRPKGKKSPES